MLGVTTCAIWRSRTASLLARKAFYGRDNAKIDAIWRRSMTNDIIDNWEASQALISAVRERKVALIGSFAGHLVHDKQIFKCFICPKPSAAHRRGKRLRARYGAVHLVFDERRGGQERDEGYARKTGLSSRPTHTALKTCSLVRITPMSSGSKSSTPTLIARRARRFWSSATARRSKRLPFRCMAPKADAAVKPSPYNNMEGLSFTTQPFHRRIQPTGA